jgi:hypothetical protein
MFACITLSSTLSIFILDLSSLIYLLLTLNPPPPQPPLNFPDLLLLASLFPPPPTHCNKVLQLFHITTSKHQT